MRPPAMRVVTTRPRDPVRGTTVAHFPLQEVDDAVDAADAITGFPSVQEFSPLCKVRAAGHSARSGTIPIRHAEAYRSSERRLAT
jgi:hypothetical protein